jgi:hypothetical protein
MLQSYGAVWNIAVWKEEQSTETMLAHGWKLSERQMETTLSVIPNIYISYDAIKLACKQRFYRLQQ